MLPRASSRGHQTPTAAPRQAAGRRSRASRTSTTYTERHRGSQLIQLGVRCLRSAMRSAASRSAHSLASACVVAKFHRANGSTCRNGPTARHPSGSDFGPRSRSAFGIAFTTPFCHLFAPAPRGPSPVDRVALVEGIHSGASISQLARTLGVSRATARKLVALRAVTTSPRTLGSRPRARDSGRSRSWSGGRGRGGVAGPAG